MAGQCDVCLEPATVRKGCACRGGDNEHAHPACYAKAAASSSRVDAWTTCAACNQFFSGPFMLALSRWRRKAANKKGATWYDKCLALRFSGIALGLVKRPQESLAMLLQAQQILAENDPDGLAARFWLELAYSVATKHIWLKNYTKAAVLLDDCAALSARLNGETSSKTLYLVMWRAKSDWYKTPDDETLAVALDASCDALEALIAEVGLDHFKTLRVSAQHGLLLLHQPVISTENHEFVKDTWKRTERLMGPNHPDTLFAKDVSEQVARELSQNRKRTRRHAFIEANKRIRLQ